MSEYLLPADRNMCALFCSIYKTDNNNRDRPMHSDRSKFQEHFYFKLVALCAVRDKENK